jgi:hypothetical protein
MTAGLAVALVALVAAPGAFGAVGTQVQPPPGEPVINSWAVSPTGPDPSQPGDRPFLSYSIAPGQTQEDSVTVWNFSNVQLNFQLYATDAFNNPQGQFSLLAGDDKPTDAGAWITMPTTGLQLAAHTSAIIPISITVPADATPGDHTAGIVASSTTSASNGGDQVQLDRRAGTRVYIRVPGKLRRDVEVSELSTVYHGSVNPLDGELEVRYTIYNAGNVRLGTRQSIKVHDLFGTVAERKPPPIEELLPGNSVTVTRRFQDVAATVRVATDVQLEPFAPANTGGEPVKLATVTRTSHAWAIPWILLAVLALLLLVMWLARRQRRRASGTVGEPPGAPGGNGAGPRPPVPAGSGAARG